MPSRPPKTLEAIVGLFVPPACREEVLGDLFERYTGPVRYIGVAISVIPCVIVSRIRRTADAQVLMMEALLIYASYLTAAWYTDKTLLMESWGFFRLAIPAVLAVAFMMFEDAWSRVRDKSPFRLTGEVAIGTLFAFLLMVRRLPDTLNLIGASASLLLVSAVRIFFRPQFGPHQIAGGPALPTGPSGLSEITKGLLAAVPVVLIAIALVSAGLRPGMVGGMILIVLLIGLQLNKSRKE
jgi:hypothetical protein